MNASDKFFISNCVPSKNGKKNKLEYHMSPNYAVIISSVKDKSYLQMQTYQKLICILCPDQWL